MTSEYDLAEVVFLLFSILGSPGRKIRDFRHSLQGDFTFLILMTCRTTFGVGKLSLTGHFVVFISLAFETTKLIGNVILNLHHNESYFMQVGRTGSPIVRVMVPVFIGRPLRRILIF